MTGSPVVATADSPQGRSVELTEERWRYIQRHVEMSGRQDELLAAIAGTRPAPRTRTLLAALPRALPFRWMRVIVEFAGDADRFVTAFGQDNDPDGLPR